MLSTVDIILQTYPLILSKIVDNILQTYPLMLSTVYNNLDIQRCYLL